MKLFFATIFTAGLFALRAAVAQDANAVPLPPDPNAPSSQPTPVPLFPSENPPPPVERPHSGGGSQSGDARNVHGAGQPAPKKTTAENAEDIADRIKFREAKTKALHDEKIQAELASAEAAKTDQDKRAALKRYYMLLYAKILKIDGSLKKLVSERSKVSLKQLDQGKVRPEEYPEQAEAR